MYFEDSAKVAPDGLKRGTSCKIRSLTPHHEKMTVLQRSLVIGYHKGGHLAFKSL